MHFLSVIIKVSTYLNVYIHLVFKVPTEIMLLALKAQFSFFFLLAYLLLD